MSLVMVLAAAITKGIFGLFLNQDSKFQGFVLSGLVGLVGVIVYVYMGLKIRLADKLLGSRMQQLRARLRIK